MLWFLLYFVCYSTPLATPLLLSPTQTRSGIRRLSASDTTCPARPYRTEPAHELRRSADGIRNNCALFVAPCSLDGYYSTHAPREHTPCILPPSRAEHPPLESPRFYFASFPGNVQYPLPAGEGKKRVKLSGEDKQTPFLSRACVEGTLGSAAHPTKIGKTNVERGGDVAVAVPSFYFASVFLQCTDCLRLDPPLWHLSSIEAGRACIAQRCANVKQQAGTATLRTRQTPLSQNERDWRR